MKKYFLLFVFIVAVDQITKFLVCHNMTLYQSIPIIDGFFNLTFVLNPGAAFGLLSGLDDTYRQTFFIVVTIIAIAAVGFLAFKERDCKIKLFSYVLIISGAFGNLIDRVFVGRVVDFLDFYIGDYHWPAFNIADSCISIGIFLIVIDIIFNKGDRRADNAQKSTN